MPLPLLFTLGLAPVLEQMPAGCCSLQRPAESTCSCTQNRRGQRLSAGLGASSARSDSEHAGEASGDPRRPSRHCGRAQLRDLPRGDSTGQSRDRGGAAPLALQTPPTCAGAGLTEVREGSPEGTPQTPARAWVHPTKPLLPGGPAASPAQPLSSRSALLDLSSPPGAQTPVQVPGAGGGTPAVPCPAGQGGRQVLRPAPRDPAQAPPPRSSFLNVIVPHGEQQCARETGFPFSLLILPSLHLKFHNQCAL